MTPALALHPMGILLGALYAAIFGGILWWMLHPPSVPQEVAQARRPGDVPMPIRLPGGETLLLKWGPGVKDPTSGRNGNNHT